MHIALFEISFLVTEIHEQGTTAIFPCWVINILKTLYFHFHKTYGYQLWQYGGLW